MSLINDALKRVSKPGNAPVPPAGGPMVPAEPPPPDYGKLLLSIFVLIVLVLAAGTFFWWKGKSETAQKTETNPSLATTITTPLNQTKSLTDKLGRQNTEDAAVADSISAPSKNPVQAASNAATKSPVVVSTQAVVAAVPVGPKFPELKLGAIYFRLRGPTAVINGKTVNLGDEIDGVKVTQIQRTSVEIEFHGQKKTLTMH